MTKRRRNEDPNPFGTELHKLLALIGVKRSGFGERGYTYSLHKQVCRGERPPSARALASLKELLNQHVATVLAATRRDSAKLEELERHLAAFTWMHKSTKNGHWTVDVAALGRLWQSRRPPGGEEGLPIVIEGTVIEPKILRSSSAPVPRLRLKHKRLILTTTENGEMRLTAILSAAGAERLRRAMTGQ